MSEAPAKRFGIEGIGKIREGYRPDFVLVDLEHETTIDKTQFLSKGSNTPFNGWKVFGAIKETIVSSKTVWKG